MLPHVYHVYIEHTYRAKIIYLPQNPLEIIHFKTTLAAPPSPPPWNWNGAHFHEQRSGLPAATHLWSDHSATTTT